MKLDEILKVIRKKLNISQEQLARDLNVSYTTLNRWENNRTNASRLAKVAMMEYCKQNGISPELIEAIKKA
jgi:DNA-binding transcriptional regulator YiaG